MTTIRTEAFRADYKKLPAHIQKLTDKKLEFLVFNLHHPSLRAKKMGGEENLWEARVTQNYRFTFQTGKDTIVLRRIGTHNILKTP